MLSNKELISDVHPVPWSVFMDFFGTVHIIDKNRETIAYPQGDCTVELANFIVEAANTLGELIQNTHQLETG